MTFLEYAKDEGKSISKYATYHDKTLIIACLVHRLGGEVEITDKEAREVLGKRITQRENEDGTGLVFSVSSEVREPQKRRS